MKVQPSFQLECEAVSLPYAVVSKSRGLASLMPPGVNPVQLISSALLQASGSALASPEIYVGDYDQSVLGQLVSQPVFSQLNATIADLRIQAMCEKVLNCQGEAVFVAANSSRNEGLNEFKKVGDSAGWLKKRLLRVLFEQSRRECEKTLAAHIEPEICLQVSPGSFRGLDIYQESLRLRQKKWFYQEAFPKEVSSNNIEPSWGVSCYKFGKHSSGSRAGVTYHRYNGGAADPVSAVYDLTTNFRQLCANGVESLVLSTPSYVYTGLLLDVLRQNLNNGEAFDQESCPDVLFGWSPIDTLFDALSQAKSKTLILILDQFFSFNVLYVNARKQGVG